MVPFQFMQAIELKKTTEQKSKALNSLINALHQPEVEVVTGLLGSASVVYEHQSRGICLPHLNKNT